MKTAITFVFMFMCLMNLLFAHEDPQKDPKSGTVIFVHGFMRTSKSMSFLASSFKRDGWHTENWSYPSRQKYIEEHAEDLVHRLNQLSKERPGEPINFVTHSMGGLIIRCALNNESCPIEAKMGRAVLIAPPNRGSELARKLHNFRIVRKVLGEKSGNQLMTTLPEGFDQLGNFPDQMPILIISGTAGWNPIISKCNDGKVEFKETCLNTPHFHEKCFAGHSWICHIPSVTKKAKAFLSMSLNQIML